MGKSFARACGLSTTTLAVVLGLGYSVAARNMGYLPKLGPTTLRFRIPPSSKTLPLPPLAMSNGPPPVKTDKSAANSKKEQTSSSPAVSSANAALGNTGAAPTRSSLLARTPTILNSIVPPSLAPATQTNQKPRPASDLLLVTPQMLLSYFKPVGSSTNQLNATVAMPVRFRPPTPATHESKATYKTQ